jgi:hypothetical protein
MAQSGRAGHWPAGPLIGVVRPFWVSCVSQPFSRQISKLSTLAKATQATSGTSHHTATRSSRRKRSTVPRITNHCGTMFRRHASGLFRSQNIRKARKCAVGGFPSDHHRPEDYARWPSLSRSDVLTPSSGSAKNSVPGNRRNCLREAPSGGNSARGTELLVDPNSGARCAIRDTGRTGAERYYWTVTAFDDHQAAAGRIGELAAARSQAEAALAAYTGSGASCQAMTAGISDGR